MGVFIWYGAFSGYHTGADGERAHLHFALLRGRSTDIRGYVSSEEELLLWVDPVSFFAD